MKDIKVQLRELIATSQTRNALEQLGAMIRSDRSSALNGLAMLRGEYSDLVSHEIGGTFSTDDIKIAKARLRSSILGFVDRLSPDDLNQAKTPLDVMEDHIVVRCNQERMAELQRLFPKIYFPYLSFQVKEEDSLPTATEIIIYDFPEGANADAFRAYLDATDHSISVLYFGAQYLAFLNDPAYVTRVHRANTQFSVHARLRELSLFLRYTYSQSDFTD
jgi:hypothetical protein